MLMNYLLLSTFFRYLFIFFSRLISKSGLTPIDKKGFVFNPIKWSWALSDRDLSVNYVTASLNEGEK